KVYAVGLYLEHPSQDPREVIESEQVKYLLTHYLTKKATAKQIQKGFLEVIEECNPPELVQANRADIDTYASWLNKDMAPGLTSYSTYIPGKGLTMTYQGEVRGTIPGSTFMQMYYRYNVGEKASKNIRKGLLGL
ncbi:MAG: chalcone isomerase family protein, partial [Deltaproteobacteria bacterium]|nr:chalcone isomerase family protein [Deltaproteobacteria bacterium]